MTLCNVLYYCSGSSLWFKLHNADRWSGGYDFSYTSAESRGCGGELFGTRGAVTSQDYPAAHNQTADCYWTIRVPQGQRVQLKFAAFMVGPEEGSCSENYVELVDGVINPNVRRLIPRFVQAVKSLFVSPVPRFCGHSSPAIHTSSSDIVTIHYVTSTTNIGQYRSDKPFHTLFVLSGTGWRALFQIEAMESVSGSTPSGGLIPSL